MERSSNAAVLHFMDDESEDEVYLDEADIIQEINLDDEDLPDASDNEEDDDDNGSSDSDVSLVDHVDDAVQVFTKHAGEVYAVACSPIDDKLVATGGTDNTGFLWRIGQGDREVKLGGHEDTVSRLAFSTDGRLLATADVKGVLNIWDASGGHKCTLNESEDGGEIEWTKWHPRDHVLLACSMDGSFRTWGANSCQPLNTFYGHGDSVTCGDFTPNGNTICTGSSDATLRTWNLTSGKCVHVVRGFQDGLTCLTIGSTSTVALTGAEDGSVNIVNTVTGKMVGDLAGHDDYIEDVALAPSFPWAATGGQDGKLIIWDLQHLSPRNTLDHKSGITCLTWLGNSRFVGAGCKNGKIMIWDSRSGELVRAFRGHSRRILSLSLSSAHNFLVSSSRDSTARVFDIAAFN